MTDFQVSIIEAVSAGSHGRIPGSKFCTELGATAIGTEMTTDHDERTRQYIEQPLPRQATFVLPCDPSIRLQRGTHSAPPPNSPYKSGRRSPHTRFRKSDPIQD